VIFFLLTDLVEKRKRLNLVVVEEMAQARSLSSFAGGSIIVEDFEVRVGFNGARAAASQELSVSYSYSCGM
jgi:hypothetical protein